MFSMEFLLGEGKEAQDAKLRGKKNVCGGAGGTGPAVEGGRKVQKLKALRQDAPSLQFC